MRIFLSLFFITSLPTLAQTKFTDVTKEAGIDHIFDVYQGLFGGGVAVFDYNNDGNLDLYLVNGGNLTQASSGKNTSALYHNNGNGTFTEVTQKATISNASNHPA